MKNIVLIGPPGTGKTAIGKKLAQITQRKFIDTDAEIENITGMSISQIFQHKGEKQFRKLENRIVQAIAFEKNTVIATGGGLILNPKNISELKRNGTIVLLEATPEKIMERIKHSNRPTLTKNAELKEEINEILKERKEIYKNAAAFCINTERDDIRQNARSILLTFNKMSSEINVKIKRKNELCKLQIGVSLSNEIADEIKKMKKSKIGIITDSNVFKLHGKKLLESFNENKLDVKLFKVEKGEQSKSLAEVERISFEMLEKGFDRNSVLIAFGGGVTGDLTGFISATFMRGISLIHIPTTLLAMVDSSIGGKTAVNLDGIKNIVGAFKQPEKVFMDLEFLKTLPEQELKNGLVEAIKTGVVADSKLFDLIETSLDEILAKDNELLIKIITKCCKTKIKIIEEDETEQNLRSILNFGHTIGHAIEITHKLNHGHAVAIGMVLESKLAEKKGILAGADVKRIKKLISRLGFNTKISKNIEQIIQKMKNDKKNSGNEIRFVFPEKIGKMHQINGAFSICATENEISEILNGCLE